MKQNHSNESEDLVYTPYITVKGKRIYKKGGGLFVFPRRTKEK
jgi:hypothetical protein